jgi:4-hydroxybenzoate polyprenyltransferase
MNPIEIYRIKDWYYYLGFILIGVLLNSSFNSKVIILLLSGSFLLAYAFSFNDFCDGKEKKRYFLLPLVLLVPLILFLNFFQILIILVFLLIVTVYSMDPIRLKTREFTGTLCNGFGFTILFLLGYFHIPILDFLAIPFFFLLFLFEMIAQLIHEMVHLKQDRKKNIITTAVLYGEAFIRRLSISFLFLSLILSIFMYYYGLINIIFLIATIFFSVLFILEFKIKKINLAFRKKYRNTSIIIGIIYFVSILVNKF